MFEINSYSTAISLKFVPNSTENYHFGNAALNIARVRTRKRLKISHP